MNYAEYVELEKCRNPIVIASLPEGLIPKPKLTRDQVEDRIQPYLIYGKFWSIKKSDELKEERLRSIPQKENKPALHTVFAHCANFLYYLGHNPEVITATPNKLQTILKKRG